MIQNKYFKWYYENPYKTYNKVKKFFLPLKWKFNIEFGKGHCSKIAHFASYDVSLKDKNDSPSYENNPRITLSLFNYIHMSLDLITSKGWIHDLVYWEAVSYWLHYGHHLPKALDLAYGWSEFDEEYNEYKEIKFEVLQQPWQKLYDIKKLNKIYYEDIS